MNMNDLINILFAEKRLAYAKELLKKHCRTDLKIVAVNRMYKWAFVCLEKNGTLRYYDIWTNQIRTDGTPTNGFGTNYIVVDPKFEKYESIPLTNNKGEYTSCPRFALEDYKKQGWFPEES